MKRLARFVSLTAVAAVVVAAVRALRRDEDPLPSPASQPTAPWPPLRTDAGTDGAPTPDASPEPNQPATEGTDEVVVPEPDGVPVATGATSPSGDAWVPPTGDGRCPDGYPIKANLRSKIFHAPGQMHYERTAPDRCYADAAAAEADGLRAAKR